MKNVLSFCDFHADIWFELRKFNAKQGDRFLIKNEQGDDEFGAGRREMRENEQGEGR